MFYHLYSNCITYEYCYNIKTIRRFSDSELLHISYLLSPTKIFKYGTPFLFDVIEYGTKLQFESPWAMNVKAILHKCGFTNIYRIERTIRIPTKQWDIYKQNFDSILHQIYHSPIISFDKSIKIEQVYPIPIEQLDKLNISLGLRFDEQDKIY